MNASRDIFRYRSKYKNPKIGLVSVYSFFRPGGVKTHILALHKEFKKRGLESKIIVPRYAASEEYGKDIILLGKSVLLPFLGVRFDLAFCLNAGDIRRLYPFM